MAHVKQKKTPTKPKDYKTLRAVWYKKLERSGFHDIEPHENSLKTWSLMHTTRRSTDPVAVALQRESAAEYYSLARQFLHTNKFKTTLEKVIWEYHTEGISYRNIAKLLKKVKIIIPNKDNINSIVKRLAHEMKLRYLPGYK